MKSHIILYNYQKGPLPIMFLIITKVLCRLCFFIGHGLKKAILKRQAIFKEEGRSKRQEKILEGGSFKGFTSHKRKPFLMLGSSWLRGRTIFLLGTNQTNMVAGRALDTDHGNKHAKPTISSVVTMSWLIWQFCWKPVVMNASKESTRAQTALLFLSVSIFNSFSTWAPHGP